MNWFDCTNTYQRIRILQQQTRAIEKDLLGLVHYVPGSHYKIPDCKHDSGYVNTSISMADKIDVFSNSDCPVCAGMQPLEQLREAYTSQFQVLINRRRANRGLSPEDSWQYIHSSYELSKTNKQITEYMAEHPHQVKCHSCELVLGPGHCEEYFEHDGKLFCNCCPINPEDYNKAGKYHDIERWQKPAKYRRDL